jgi:site-specific recombinase XerD
LRCHPNRPPTEWRTLRRYLSYLKTPLADWACRYQTLRQVTADDIHTAVTAVKGARAHERAVALRSIFRALKQTKLIFTDPTRGLSVTRHEHPFPKLCPLTASPDSSTSPTGPRSVSLSP